MKVEGPRAVDLPAAPAATPVPRWSPNTVEAFQQAMKGPGTDERALLQVLEQNPPAVLAQIAAAYEAQTGRTMRAAVVAELSGADRRRALAALDALLVNPADATGTSGLADKVLALRTQGSVSTSELVNTYRPTANNRLELLIQGDTAFPRMMADVDAATDHVHVSFYIFNNDPQGNELADHLIAAKRRGCDVRVMVDGIGSQLVNPLSANHALFEKLAQAGVEIRQNPVVDVTRDAQVLNHPDHRKLVIVDGKVGYTGGMNMAAHYRSAYHDVLVRAEGDVVKQMQSEWQTAWLRLGGTLPGDDATFRRRYYPEVAAVGTTRITAIQAIPGENAAILAMYLQRIDGASKTIRIENPYCTNPDVQNALIRAAKRGVDVTVILPGESDHAFSHLAAAQKYPEMISAGVKLYEYPGFNHDKVMVVDDAFTTVGSSNLDDVALFHISELNLNVEDAAFARETRDRLFAPDVALSRQLKAGDVSELTQLTGKFWNLFGHFL